MFTTAYRTLIDLVRREKKQGNMEEANYSDLSHSSQYSDLQEVLHNAIDQLPADQKAVTMLRDYEGYSYKEIERKDKNQGSRNYYCKRSWI